MKHPPYFLILAGALVLVPALVSAFEATPRDGTGTHEVTIPAPAPAGESKEVSELLRTPRLVVQQIVLRKRLAMPAHAAPQHVVVQSLTGEAVIKAGGKTMKLGPRRLVVLAPNVEHSVEPADTMVELVVFRQMRPGRGPRPGRR